MILPAARVCEVKRSKKLCISLPCVRDLRPTRTKIDPDAMLLLEVTLAEFGEDSTLRVC